MKRLVFLLFLVSLVSTPLFAWGEKGHYISNEAATYGVPPAMPTFFHKAYPQIIYESYDPDRWRGAGESLDAVNPPDHFLDYEYVADLHITPDRYDFIDLEYRSGTLRKYAITNTSSGFVPWKVSELCDLLQQEWSLWRKAATKADRLQIEQNIIATAGVLGHFVADSANPHHASINYNGWILPNPNHYLNTCTEHSRFETEFVNHVAESKDVYPLLRPLQPRSDYFAAEIELLHESNSLVEKLYRIDRDGGFSGKGTAEGRAFVLDRLAAGASLLRDLWYSTYINSAKVSLKD